jgi:hypothetical protein
MPQTILPFKRPFFPPVRRVDSAGSRLRVDRAGVGSQKILLPYVAKGAAILNR